MHASVFARKISDFCRIRLAPLLPPREAERLGKYLVALVTARNLPPRIGKSYAWGEIASGCRITPEAITSIALQLRPALDAISREMPSLPKLNRPKQAAKAERKPAPASPKPRAIQPARKAKPERKPARPSHQDSGPSASIAGKPRSSGAASQAIVPEAAVRSKRGRPRCPVVEFPEPLWSPIRQPDSFRDALRLQMQRHGDSAMATAPCRYIGRSKRLASSLASGRSVSGCEGAARRKSSTAWPSSGRSSGGIVWRKVISAAGSPTKVVQPWGTRSRILSCSRFRGHGLKLTASDSRTP